MEFVDRTLVFFRKFKEHCGVVYLRLKMPLSLNLLFQAAAVLEQLLRSFLIVPEVGRRRLSFDLVQLFAARRDIKETSRVVRLAREDRQTKLAVPAVTKSRSS